jgi:hypothetical protein
MPYVDLFSTNDYASIWYRTNSRFGNVGSFEPDKPTIVILHPLFLDSTWLDSHFGDPRLNSAFNIIAFDMRVCGKSFCQPSGFHDSWVEAADLAFLYHVRLIHVLFAYLTQPNRHYIYHQLTSWLLRASQRTAQFGSRLCVSTSLALFRPILTFLRQAFRNFASA